MESVNHLLQDHKISPWFVLLRPTMNREELGVVGQHMGWQMKGELPWQEHGLRREIKDSILHPCT